MMNKAATSDYEDDSRAPGVDRTELSEIFTVSILALFVAISPS